MTEIRNVKTTQPGSDTHAGVLNGTFGVRQVLTPPDVVNNGTTAGPSILPRLIGASLLRLPSASITTPPNSLMSITMMIANGITSPDTDVTFAVQRDGSAILGPVTVPAARFSSQEVSSTHNVFQTTPGTHTYSIKIIGTAPLKGGFATEITFIQAKDTHACDLSGANTHDTVEGNIIKS